MTPTWENNGVFKQPEIFHAASGTSAAPELA